MKDESGLKHVGMQFKRIHNKIVYTLNKELEVYDITLMQSEMIKYIEEHEQSEEVCQKQLEKYFNATNPTITGILKRLEAKDLVKRELSQQDARFKKLTLTHKGEELAELLRDLGPKKLESRITKRLSQEEVNELHRLLCLVLEGFGEEDCHTEHQ